MNLLGLPAIKSLQHLQQVYSVSSLEQTIREKFPKVFQGLGSLDAPYTIKLKEGAKPYTLYAPRNISFALCDKVRDELHRMESMGVIKKITEPSEWCAVIVIVTKSTGAVRISNRSIPVCCGNLIQSQRSTRPLPSYLERLFLVKLMRTLDIAKSP